LNAETVEYAITIPANMNTRLLIELPSDYEIILNGEAKNPKHSIQLNCGKNEI